MGFYVGVLANTPKVRGKGKTSARWECEMQSFLHLYYFPVLKWIIAKHHFVWPPNSSALKCSYRAISANYLQWYSFRRYIFGHYKKKQLQHAWLVCKRSRIEWMELSISYTNAICVHNFGIYLIWIVAK